MYHRTNGSTLLGTPLTGPFNLRRTGVLPLSKLSTQNAFRPLLVCAIVLALIFVGIQAAGEPAIATLRYERTAVTDGEWWRLLTANVIHAGWPHLGLNLAGLALALATVGNGLTAGRFSLAMLTGGAATTLGLWAFDPQVSWYLGASGALHGLFIAGALPLAIRHDSVGIGVVVLLVTKLAWEQASGPLAGTEALSGVFVIVDAHLYGSIGGLVALVPAALYRYRVYGTSA